MKTLRIRWKRFSAAYTAFVDKQGFAVIMLSCIAVIILTALWTGRTAAPPTEPTPPLDDGAWAAQLEQQSLAEATTPAPVSTPAPWQAPLADYAVLRSFDASRLVQSRTTGVWQLHDAVDLSCSAGQPVYAMADGVVCSAGEDELLGVHLTIDHGQGYEALYAGLALPMGLRAGDPVQAGQTIGFSGNRMAEEADLPPHIHLRLTHSGQAVDPLPLLPKQP